MIRVISVRFRDGGKTYYFSPGEFDINEGDGVIVETARGVEFADVVAPPQDIEEDRIVAPLKGVIRVATPYDREQRDMNRAKEKDAYDICVQKIADHKLDMKLVDVEYSFNGSKVIFYFTADGRADARRSFRTLRRYPSKWQRSKACRFRRQRYPEYAAGSCAALSTSRTAMRRCASRCPGPGVTCALRTATVPCLKTTL